MWKWIKKRKEEKKQKEDYIRILQEQARLIVEEDEEWERLVLLQDPICGKHHG